jgi:hypothetical protein
MPAPTPNDLRLAMMAGDADEFLRLLSLFDDPFLTVAHGFHGLSLVEIADAAAGTGGYEVLDRILRERVLDVEPTTQRTLMAVNCATLVSGSPPHPRVHPRATTLHQRAVNLVSARLMKLAIEHGSHALDAPLPPLPAPIVFDESYGDTRPTSRKRLHQLCIYQTFEHCYVEDSCDDPARGLRSIDLLRELVCAGYPVCDPGDASLLRALTLGDPLLGPRQGARTQAFLELYGPWIDPDQPLTGILMGRSEAQHALPLAIRFHNPVWAGWIVERTGETLFAADPAMPARYEALDLVDAILTGSSSSHLATRQALRAAVQEALLRRSIA